MGASSTGTYVAVSGQLNDNIVTLAKMTKVPGNAGKLIGYDGTGLVVATSTGMVSLGEVTVAGAATDQISFTGLNGDADGAYIFLGRIIVDGSQRNIDLRLNLDSGNTYEYGAYGYVAGTGAAGGTATAQAQVGGAITVDASKTGVISGFIFAKSGQARCGTFQGGNDSCKQGNFQWNNSADNITSFQIRCAAGSIIQIGSSLKMWKIG